MCVSSFQTHICTASPCLLTADNAAQCSGNSRLLFQVPSEILSPSLFLSLPLSPLVCLVHQSRRWRVVMCWEEREGVLFSLKPQALFGNWLVCVCVVHNGCVYIGFGVHTFIHACTLIHTCRLLFFLWKSFRFTGFCLFSVGFTNQ